MPMPAPMHWVARPYLPPLRRSSCATVLTRRAPVAPSGWPMAIEPPLTLTRSSGMHAHTRRQPPASEWRASRNGRNSSAHEHVLAAPD
jgi:hypothetical protein